MILCLRRRKTSRPLTSPLQLETARLKLRSLEDRDRADFAAMNADLAVMRYFAAPLTREESDEAVDRYTRQLERDGFSFLATESREDGEFLGILGMQVMRVAVPNLPQPAIEVGWRLKCTAQGKGFATEGARALVDHAFQTLDLPEIVAITVPDNTGSRHVMEKLGMVHRAELMFEHPLVPAGHRYRQHVLYSLKNPKEVSCSV